MESVYCFAPEGISIVDVQEKKVIQTIEAPGHSWSDGVVTKDQKFILMNDPRGSQVVVLDLQKNEIVKTIPVGKAPIHLYLTPDGREVWTHSDVEGSLYAIDVATMSIMAKVDASLTGKGHGKLLVHHEMGNKGNATNAIDSAIHVVDTLNKKVTGTIGTSGVTHGKAYSPVSKHAYMTVGATGLAVIDPQTDTSLKEIDGGGQVFVSRDGKTLIANRRQQGELVVIDAISDEVIAKIACPGGPDHVFIFEIQSGRQYALSINVEGSTVSVHDLEARNTVKTIPIGNIIIPEGQQHVHRNGDADKRSLFVPSSASQTLDIVDSESLDLTSVPLGMKVQQAVYVGKDGIAH
ncbi:MAG: YncE family protein [Nitrososphaerales archaeon]